MARMNAYIDFSKNYTIAEYIALMSKTRSNSLPEYHILGHKIHISNNLASSSWLLATMESLVSFADYLKLR